MVRGGEAMIPHGILSAARGGPVFDFRHVNVVRAHVLSECAQPRTTEGCHR